MYALEFLSVVQTTRSKFDSDIANGAYDALDSRMAHINE